MVDFLAEPISKMKKLRVLYLSRNPLTKLGTLTLINSLAKGETKPPLEELNLTGTLLKDDGCFELLPIVAEYFDSLKKLNLSATRLTGESTKTVCTFLQMLPSDLKQRLTLELRL